MTVETDSERAIFFAADDFGINATLTIDGQPSQVTGIFDNDYQDLDAGGSVPFAASEPTFHARTADMVGVEEGDALTVDDEVYTISVVMSDGTGLTMLRLERQ